MNELYEINSVMVHGETSHIKNILVLQLGTTEGGSDYQSYISFLLTNWGAQAIMDSLYSAGVRPRVREEIQERTESNENS